MKALICYNPFSGKQTIEKKLDYIIKRLKSRYDVVDCYRSLLEKSITTYIKNFGHNYSLILVAGGDGSLNEAVNGVMSLSNKPTIAYIPFGTVNDVGHMLKLNKNIRKVMDIILNNEPVKMDICKIYDRYFVYASAVGNFTNVSYKAPSRLKKHFGKMAYFMEAARELKADETIYLTLENDNLKITGKYYVMLALNSKRIAGFRLYRTKPPKLNDGLIDITLLRKQKFKTSIFYLIFFFLFGDHLKRGVETICVNNIKINSPTALSYNVDGEFAFSSNEVSIEVVHEAINIIVNNKIKKNYF